MLYFSKKDICTLGIKSTIQLDTPAIMVGSRPPFLGTPPVCKRSCWVPARQHTVAAGPAVLLQILPLPGTPPSFHTLLFLAKSTIFEAGLPNPLVLGSFLMS